MSRLKANQDLSRTIATIAILAAIAYALFGEVGIGILALVLMLMAK